MKLIMDTTVSDRVDGKVISYKAGDAVDFPDAIGEVLVAKGAGHDFPKTKDEETALKDAVKHPIPKPEVSVKK